MGKRLPHTPNSKIKASLRQLSLRSRERAGALKKANYCCDKCGVKQSKAKGKEVSVTVHHKRGIDWHEIYEYIRQKLLNQDDMQVLCNDCHDKIHQA